MSNPDFDNLPSFLLGFARQILPKRGGFAPFAAAISKEGKMKPIATYDREYTSAHELIELLVAGTRADIKAGKFVARSLCTDVRVKPPKGRAKVDAIEVHLEDDGGECLDVFLPYEKTIVSRRRLLISAAALVSLRAPGFPFAAAAEQDRALFWRVGSGTNASIVFGYVRIGASVAPDVVSDGERLLESVHAVVTDMPANVRFPPLSVDRKQVKPIVQVVSPAVAEELRAALGATPAQAVADSISGFETTVILMSEGQHPSNPSIGGTIVGYAAAHGHPMRQLLTNDEVAGTYQAPDLAAVNARIGEGQITYLLQLRQRFGPIGGHLEQLYRARQSEEIDRFTADIDKHGVPSLSALISGDRLRALIVDRATRMLSDRPSDTALLLLPLGVLTGPNGLLAALEARGVAVTPVA